MKLEFMHRIRRFLPRGFRIWLVPGSLEGPREFIWKVCPPNYNYIQKASRLGFLGLFRGWVTIGELDDDEDIIFLREEFFDKFLPTIQDVLGRASLDLPIEKGSTLSGRRYRQRLVGGPL